MGLLLDTNVLIPIVEEDLDSLPGALREEIERGSAEMIVSVVSLWEAAIKHRHGKLPIRWALEDWPTILFVLGIHLFDLEVKHVLAVVHPLPDTKDPFDRMLLAVCEAEDLRLVTTDSKLVSHPLAWRPGSA